jgi:hypothetical protein
MAHYLNKPDEHMFVGGKLGMAWCELMAEECN